MSHERANFKRELTAPCLSHFISLQTTEVEKLGPFIGKKCLQSLVNA